MSRFCTVCTNDKLDEINRELCDPHTVLGQVASQYGLGRESLRRHRVSHLPAHLAQAQEAETVAQAGDLLAKVCGLEAEAHRIKDKAEAAGDLKTALAGIAQLVKIIELLAKLRGELQQEGTVNIVVNAEWVALRSSIMLALIPYPEARLALAAVLHATNP